MELNRYKCRNCKKKYITTRTITDERYHVCYECTIRPFLKTCRMCKKKFNISANETWKKKCFSCWCKIKKNV